MLIPTRQIARSLLLRVLLPLVLLGSPAANATTVVLNWLDTAGEGIYDTTPATPVGGNTGTTIGEQRQIAMQYAAAMIENIIDSTEPILINVDFTNALTCTASSATLASAGAVGWTQVGGLPLSNTWYPLALINALLNTDINPSASDINIDFNRNIDNNNGCLSSTNWYYGLDGNASGDIDMITTALHEVIHGLGFQTVVDVTTGIKPSGDNDVYMVNLEDHSLNKNWGDTGPPPSQAMSDSQRSASAIDDGDLHWTGSNVTANLGGLSGGTSGGHMQMYAPGTLKLGSSVTHFDTDATPNEMMEPVNTGPKDSIGLAREVLADMGWPLFATNGPIISSIDNHTQKNDEVGNISFALMDNDTAMTGVTVTPGSSNTAVIPLSGLGVSGTGRNRTLSIDPVNGTSGQVTVSLTASDGSNNSVTDFVVTVTNGLPPVVTISNPADGATLYSAPQSFTASAIDPEDLDISASLSWESSLDSGLGSGANISPSLSEGTHLISVEVTDSGLNTVVESITVTVDLTGDADGDGLSNQLEVALGTNPESSDTDDDGLSDFDEVNRDGDPTNYTPGIDTDPNNSDTDGDGAPDGIDFDPLDPEVGIVSVTMLPLLAMLALTATIGLLGTGQLRRRRED